MGEVYRARDTKLNREVALKILPITFTHDLERVARFRREAQVLAALNHPHIGAIYGLDEAHGTQFLVLELVGGETLDKRIARGAIPVDEALGIATQIAEALEAAHEKGIIHRDLKPANIALTSDGHVKVLDFGLAKATDAAGAAPLDVGNSPTITSPAMMTGVGVMLGTAAYMSPEQAKGRAADKRSDVWAFGCVLYEMLTGKRAFEGEDVSDTLANVLKSEPHWTAWPPTVPEPIRLLVRRCLEKDRSKRVADASTARFLLTEPLLTASPVVAPAGAVRATPPLWRRGLLLVITALVTAGMTGLVAWRAWRVPIAPVTRFTITLPGDQRFANRSQVLAISPDGSRVVYVGNAPPQLYLRSMADLEARPIAGTNLDPMSPFFSPDGQWIGFYSFHDRTLSKIAVSGGASLVLCKTTPPHGVTWDGNWIIFADEGAKGIFEGVGDRRRAGSAGRSPAW
jgi:serine/threonine-protein kinase